MLDVLHAPALSVWMMDDTWLTRTIDSFLRAAFVHMSAGRKKDGFTVDALVEPHWRIHSCIS
jgi:hypothetical protein